MLAQELYNETCAARIRQHQFRHNVYHPQSDASESIAVEHMPLIKSTIQL